MNKPGEELLARVQFWAWVTMAPLSLIAYIFTNQKFLLGFNLGLSVWTGVVAAKSDLDTIIAKKKQKGTK